MKSKIKIAITVGLLALFIGCDTSSDSDASQKTRTLPELVKLAMNESEDFSFCIKDEAGNESLKECSERIGVIVAALPDSISGSELPSDRKEKLSQEIENLKTAYDGIVNAVESNGSDSVKSKANSSFRTQLKVFAKLSK